MTSQKQVSARSLSWMQLAQSFARRRTLCRMYWYCALLEHAELQVLDRPHEDLDARHRAHLAAQLLDHLRHRRPLAPAASG
ncbi:MAG: hypothetical protein U1F50_01065 [Rubrivivax sp.]